MNAVLRTIRGLLSRPLTNTSQPDVPSPLDVEDVWGWGGSAVGLTRGQRARFEDLGYSDRTIRELDADVRAANAVR